MIAAMRSVAAILAGLLVACHGASDLSAPAPVEIAAKKPRAAKPAPAPKPKPAPKPAPAKPPEPPPPPPPPPPTTVTHQAPRGVEETCQLLVPFPFTPSDVKADPEEPRWYREDDFEEIAELCRMSMYAPETTEDVTAVGICPKTHWSTPALEVHALDKVGMKKADFERRRCKWDRRRRGAKKLAKFKVRVYDKEPESGLMYFHFSRLLAANAYMMPVTYRTVSRRELQRWTGRAIATLKARTLPRLNPLGGWSVLRYRHRKGDEVIPGAFSQNARGEHDNYKFAYFDDRRTRIWHIYQFRSRPYYKLVARSTPVKKRLRFDVRNVKKFDRDLQALATAQDFTHMLLLDHVFNQRDRSGNINARVRYHYLDDAGHLRWKKKPKARDDADAMVPLDRLLLKDNDDGLRWDRFGSLNASRIIDEVKHLDHLTYDRLQWLAGLMTDAATKDAVKAYFVDSVHIGPATYDQVSARLVATAREFAAKHAAGKLALDLDLEPFLAIRPHPRKPSITADKDAP